MKRNQEGYAQATIQSHPDLKRDGFFYGGRMVIKICVLTGYFLIVLAIGLVAKARWKSTPESYFLADRGLGTLVLLGTMVATNFSAFTVFGTSGAGYRDGVRLFSDYGVRDRFHGL